MDAGHKPIVLEARDCLGDLAGTTLIMLLLLPPLLARGQKSPAELQVARSRHGRTKMGTGSKQAARHALQRRPGCYSLTTERSAHLLRRLPQHAPRLHCSSHDFMCLSVRGTVRMNLFKELDIEDRLQWKRHQMIFAMQARHGSNLNDLQLRVNLKVLL